MNNTIIPLWVLTPDEIEGTLIPWLEKNRTVLYEKIRTKGGILLRGFGLHAVSEFNKIAQTVAPNLLSYIYQSSPRTLIGGKIYTSTEYPKDQTIPQHSENSYTNHWPELIMFFSILVAATGGQTPVADNRKVYQRIPENIRKKFTDKKILYVRNYHEGIDLSWQTVFQTSDRKAVEDFCQKNNIQWEWCGKNDLRTKQICQAVLEHPNTKEIVWFNQAHLFHISNLPESHQKLLLEQFSQEELPRNTYYGDGSEIDVKDLDQIRQAYLQERCVFDWEKGNIMVLDNVLMSHGREPFTGNRKVVVAMA